MQATCSQLSMTSITLASDCEGIKQSCKCSTGWGVALQFICEHDGNRPEHRLLWQRRRQWLLLLFFCFCFFC